ncbi:MAG TPA: hypothetical protein PKW79_03690 [Rhabdochlamydiaceae bacterium]|nr:hypothetical protein [Rhabdochlamydiaceae bacterium]
MTKGYKTTEFWVTILTIIGSIAGSLEKILDPNYAAIAATVSTIVYTISRTFAKNLTDVPATPSN